MIKYTCVETIEERIEQILAEKQELFDEIVDDVTLDVSTRLTGDDLFRLFGLEPRRAEAAKKPDLQRDSARQSRPPSSLISCRIR